MQTALRSGQRCYRLAEAEDVAVGILDVEVRVAPRPLLERRGDPRAARAQLLIERVDAAHGDVGVEVLVLLAVQPVGERFGAHLRCTVTPSRLTAA